MNERRMCHDREREAELTHDPEIKLCVGEIQLNLFAYH